MDLNKILSPHNFFQQVRTMLRRLTRGQGTDSKQVLEEQLYFVSPLSLDAPKGEITAVTPLEEQRWQVEVSGHGLTGTLGALPTVYTEWMIERYYRHGDVTAKAFLDIFNHRLHSLRYLAWQKYHYYAMAEFCVTRPLSTALRALSGVTNSSPSLQQEQFADLFAHSVRSMLNFETWLKHCFSVGVKVTPFTGGWQTMEPELCCCLGNPAQPLAVAPMLGGVYWDRQAHFTVTMGPVPITKSYGRIFANMSVRDWISTSTCLLRINQTSLRHWGTGNSGWIFALVLLRRLSCIKFVYPSAGKENKTCQTYWGKTTGLSALSGTLRIN